MSSPVTEKGTSLQNENIAERNSSDALIGACWCIGGIIVTVVTGGYILAWGAILFGAGQCLRGLSHDRSRLLPFDRERDHHELHASAKLYLRSFRQDGRGDPTLFYFINVGVLHTHEQSLVSILSTAADVFTVGNPSESLPELGAHRIYLDDEIWQHEVINLMTSASLVVINVDNSKALLWEIDTAFRLLEPHRLLLFLSFCQESETRRIQYGYQVLAEIAKQYFRNSIPMAAMKYVSFIRFNQDWLAEPIASKSRTIDFELIRGCEKALALLPSGWNEGGKVPFRSLPQEILCPDCGVELRLDMNERTERKFLCYACQETFVVTD